MGLTMLAFALGELACLTDLVLAVAAKLGIAADDNLCRASGDITHHIVEAVTAYVLVPLEICS